MMLRGTAAATACVAVLWSSAASAASISSPASAEEIRSNTAARVRHWYPRVRVDAPVIRGRYALSVYHAGEEGGVAIYHAANGHWHFVCGGGGGMDLEAAEGRGCGLSKRDAERLLR